MELLPGIGLGYVGVGTVSGEAMRFDDAVLKVDGVETRMTDLALSGTYRHHNGADDNEEWVVPIEWVEAVDRSDAVWEKGFFANQNSACKLRNRFTLEGLTRRFDLGD